MKESKQVTEVKRKTSEIPMRDEKLHSEDIPFLRGGLQSGVRPRELGTAPLVWPAPKLSHHTLPILLKMDYILLELFFSPKWCVLNEGWRLPFIVLPWQLLQGPVDGRKFTF